jgi:hypothetical protein
VGGGHQNHTPLSDGTGGLGLQLGTNLIDNDHFRHVVFHRLNHHLVLQLRASNLHPAGPANGRMRNVAITGDLIACIYYYHPLIELISQHPGDLAQGGGLAHTRTAHQQ